MSIIGDAIMLGGGGGGFATATLVAPKGSTISWTGEDTGSVSLSSNETYTIVSLAKGIYVFTNTLTYTVRGASHTDNIWTRTVNLTGDMTINVYPDDAIWWYGLLNEQFVAAEGSTVSMGTDGVFVTAVNSQLHTALRSANVFPVGGKTALKARVALEGNIQTDVPAQTAPRFWDTNSGSWTSVSSNVSRTTVFTNVSEYTAIIGNTGDYSIGFRAGRSSGDYYNKYIYLYAIWLE